MAQTTTQRLQVIVDAENKTNAAFKKINDNLDSHKARLQDIARVSKTVAKFGTVALAAIGTGVGFAVKSASDLVESINAVNVVFGDSADGILKLSENASTAVGLSKKDFNSLAVQFSNFAGIVAGDGGDVVKTMSDLTGRSADFASVMNIGVNEAATLFQSGLAGQTEPLRRYGIDLSAAAVKHHALATGIIETDREMTEAEKVTARYSLLMESTAKTQGDFANTSDNLANKQRILSAQFENMKAKIGEAFVPIIEELLDKLAPLVDKTIDWIEENPKLVKSIVLVVGALALLAAVLGTIGMILPAIVAGFGIISWPVLAVIAAITALIIIGVKLYKHWDEIKKRAKEIWESIGEFFTNAWETIKTTVKDAIKSVKDTLSSAWTSIKDAVSEAWDGIVEVVSMAWTAIKDFLWAIWSAIIQKVTEGWNWLANKFKTATESLKKAWSAMWEGMTEAANLAWEGVKNTVKASINWIIERINAIIMRINEVMQKGAGIIGVSAPQIPTIPLLAKGGIVKKPTLAMVGEQGPEAVIPLNRTNLAGAAGGMNITINISGNEFVGEEGIAEKIGDDIMRALKQNIKL